MYKVDVLVAGAGPAGLASAIVLAQAGRSVLLVDKGTAKDYRAGEHLGPGAGASLERLGFEKRDLDQDHYSFAGMRVFWGSEEARFQDALFRLGGSGWILDRFRFNEQLKAKAEALACQFLYGTSVQEISPASNGWTTTLRDKKGKRSVESLFLVDATGRVAKGARLLGAKVNVEDRLIGTCILQALPFHDAPQGSKWGHLESAPQGWWFSTEIPGARRASYWMSDLPIRNTSFLDHLAPLLTQAPQTKALLARSGKVIEVFQRPAHSQCLDQCAGSRWIAVGDAASSFDPMASEGMAKGLRTGIAGGEAALAALAGDDSLLLNYDQTRQEEYREYLSHKATQYGMERRWPTEAFWAKRHLSLK